MLRINQILSVGDLKPFLSRFWELSGQKLLKVNDGYDFSRGAPVFTVEGRYSSRGWTEWTLGFHYGSAVLQYDSTRDPVFLEIGQDGTRRRMVHHLTHMGVHDHGFNIVSTFGNLLRLLVEGRFEGTPWEDQFYRLGLRVSGAVQARRWTSIPDGGFIYSFNGPHSLFVDTIRSLRSLAVAFDLGQVLLEEGDQSISLLERLVVHGLTTARYSVYYGEGRDAYDVRGRTAHESLFNTIDGSYRCPSTQQGYSSRSTWTRGLAWAILGYAEQLEFLAECSEECFPSFASRDSVLQAFLKAAEATADFYIESSPANGVPYWDTGAPGLTHLANYLDEPADPFNDFEPVDSSAAAIAAQGLLRLGHYLGRLGHEEEGRRYWQAGLTITRTLLDDPYLGREDAHEGLLLHSLYHRPNGWDHVPEGRRVPSGESSMWGDYHLREVALYLWRILVREPYLTFWIGRSQETTDG